MKKSIILIGAGGHCKACIEVIEAENKFKIAAIVDIKEKIGQKILSYCISASDRDLATLIKKHKNFLITVGQIKNGSKRVELFDQVKKLGGHFPTIIASTANVSKHAKVSEGTIVMHGAKINAGVVIGKNCIVNTSAIVEHDAVIEDHCHLATGSIVNGECNIGAGTFIGSNSVVINNLNVTAGVILGAGAVVIKNITQPGTYAGNPAHRVG